MKRLSIALTLILVTAGGVRDAFAQIVGRIQFTTAFPFTVGNTTLPGGTYSIASDSLEPSLLVIRGWNTSVFEAATESSPSRAPARSEVVFERFGNGYILKSVWVAGSTVGYQLNVRAAERRLARTNEAPNEVRVSAHLTARRPKLPTAR